MILVIMTLEGNPKYKDNKKCIKEGLEKIVILVQQWLEEGKIIGVVDFNGIVHQETYKDIEDWIFQPSFIDKHKKKV